jgi:TonB family protein
MPKLRWLLIGVGLWAILATSVPAEDRPVVSKVPPTYPALLKSKGIGGTVRLEVLVSESGNVKKVTVLGGNPILCEAAESAVKRWKFAARSGESKTVVAIEFDPRQ